MHSIHSARCPLHRRLRLGALTVSLTAASLSPAHASGRGKQPMYPETMQRVVDYIQSNPGSIGSIPMYYEPSSELRTPLPQVIDGLRPQDVLPPTYSPPAAALAAGGAGPGLPRPKVDHFARTVAALLYLAVGGLDQAHNLITPLCWGAPTAYGGAPITGSPAARDAAYVHALVHRAEGFSDGEFGTGFSNANYWYAAASAASHPISQPLLQEVRRLAQGNNRLEQVASSHGEGFQPSKFVDSCIQALSKKDAELSLYCNAVAAAEWSLLLNHCYQRLQDTCKEV